MEADVWLWEYLLPNKLIDKKTISFNGLSWAVLFYYYQSAGDQKYSRILNDTIIGNIRYAPENLDPKEFEQKVILDYVNIQNYDLLLENKLAEAIINALVRLQPEVITLLGRTSRTIDLEDQNTLESITKIYATLSSIKGLWLTGASKIAHLLNEQLLPIVSSDIIKHLRIHNTQSIIESLLTRVHLDVKLVDDDFLKNGNKGTPESYLSEKLGYTKFGINKSIVKYLDEYYWLSYKGELPLPPRWIPDH